MYLSIAIFQHSGFVKFIQNWAFYNNIHVRAWKKLFGGLWKESNGQIWKSVSWLSLGI